MGFSIIIKVCVLCFSFVYACVRKYLHCCGAIVSFVMGGVFSCIFFPGFSADFIEY